MKWPPFHHFPPHNYDLAIQIYWKGLSRKVYTYLQDDVMLIHSKCIKWIEEIGPDFEPSLCDFGAIHNDIYSITNVPKYRSFQYRLLQRGIITNIHLHKWQMRDNNSCSFCQETAETYSHLFYECSKIKPIWTFMVEYVQERFGIVIMDLSVQDVLMNRFHMSKTNVCNLIGLVIKYSNSMVSLC